MEVFFLMKWHDIEFLILPINCDSNDNSSLFVSQYFEVQMAFLIQGEVNFKLQFSLKPVHAPAHTKLITT